MDDLKSRRVRIDPRFSVICVDFCGSCRFGELGEPEKRESTRIDRAHQAWPGTSIGWLGIDTCTNRSTVFCNLWWFLVVFGGFRGGGGERRELDEQLISGIDRAHQVWSEIGSGDLKIDTCANRFRLFFYCCIFLSCFCSILRFKATRGMGEKK